LQSRGGFADNPKNMTKIKKKLTMQEKEIVRYMFLFAAIGLVFAAFLPYLF
jgi:hypothetical protein